MLAFAPKGQAGVLVRALRAAELLQLSQKTVTCQMCQRCESLAVCSILLCCRNTHLCIFLIQAHDLCAWTSPTGELELGLHSVLHLMLATL